MWHTLAPELPSSFWFVVVLFWKKTNLRPGRHWSGGDVLLGQKAVTQLCTQEGVFVCYCPSLRSFLNLASLQCYLSQALSSHVTSLQLSGAQLGTDMLFPVHTGPWWVRSCRCLWWCLPGPSTAGNTRCCWGHETRPWFTCPSVALRAWLRVISALKHTRQHSRLFF